MSTYKNLPVCDLRGMSKEAFKTIEQMENIAMLIIPKDADTEIAEAIAGVPKQNIALTLPLPDKAVICTINGTSILCDADFTTNEEKVIIANGMTVVERLTSPANASLVVNGMLVLPEHLKNSNSINILVCNGSKRYLDFDDCKFLNDSVSIDSETLNYIKPRTALVSGSTITISSEITAKQLSEKSIRFIARDFIFCPQELIPYLNMFSVAKGVKAQ